MKNPFIALFAMALASCGAPKAIVVAEAPKEKPIAPVETPSEPSPPPPALTDDLRIGDDILNLPSDEQLRSSQKPAGEGDGTLIARPPAE